MICISVPSLNNKYSLLYLSSVHWKFLLSLTSELVIRFAFHLIRQPKINNFDLLIFHIKQDVFRLQIIMNHPIFLATNSGLKDLGEISPSLVLHKSFLTQNAPQILAAFWFFHNVSVVILRCEDFVELYDVAVLNFV